jgi:Polyketide cyclase / dehydrase and lipid transport
VTHTTTPRSRRRRTVVAIVVVTLAVVLAILLALSERGIRLGSDAVVSLTREQAWRFFQDTENLAKWDRSVARVEPTTTGPIRRGFTFDTIAPRQPGHNEGQRMSYRVADFEPYRWARIELIGSDMFKRAEWHVMLEPDPRGTRVVTEVVFVPRLRYFFLTPVLFFSRGNLETDMRYLHEQMEAYGRG